MQYTGLLPLSPLVSQLVDVKRQGAMPVVIGSVHERAGGVDGGVGGLAGGDGGDCGGRNGSGAPTQLKPSLLPVLPAPSPTRTICWQMVRPTSASHTFEGASGCTLRTRDTLGSSDERCHLVDSAASSTADVRREPPAAVCVCEIESAAKHVPVHLEDATSRVRREVDMVAVSVRSTKTAGSPRIGVAIPSYTDAAVGKPISVARCVEAHHQETRITGPAPHQVRGRCVIKLDHIHKALSARIPRYEQVTGVIIRPL